MNSNFAMEASNATNMSRGRHGGVLYITNSTLSLLGCNVAKSVTRIDFIQNTAWNGGAIYLTKNSRMYLIDCNMIQNCGGS
jgi:predicted outer membrane repeat protein